MEKEEYQLLIQVQKRRLESSDASDEAQERVSLENSNLQSQTTTRWTASLLTHAVLILISTTMFVLSFRNGNHKQGLCSEFTPSILGREWDTHIFRQRFNGTLRRPSTYKGPPSEAVDQAWDRILPLHLIRISELEFRTLNASKYSTEIYDAEGGRIAIFEAFHMMHCVRALWQNTYPEYYSTMHAHNQAHQKEWHEHMDHCADILRQKLMCDADASMVTGNWIKNHYYPRGNFNVEHQCRDYNRLLEFAKERRIDDNILRPPGKKVVEFEEAPFSPDADS